jgi:hypothetical protein
LISTLLSLGLMLKFLGNQPQCICSVKPTCLLVNFHFLITSLGKMMLEVAKMYYTNFVDTEEDSIKANSKTKNNWKTDCRCLFLRKKGGGQLMKQYVSNF